MTLLVGSFTMGLILALLALGVLISFRILGFRDLTVDGSFALGGAVAATLIVLDLSPIVVLIASWLDPTASGWIGFMLTLAAPYGHLRISPWIATLVAAGCGAFAGAVTGTLSMKFRINGLLAGILVMTALYSVNLRVMGKSNVPLMDETTVFTFPQNIANLLHPTLGQRVASGELRIPFGLWHVPVLDVYVIALAGLIIAVLGGGMYVFFRTNLGLAMRATGDNPDMIRALGVDVGWMTTFGLALSNALVALSGALLVQYQGFADVQMGIGMVVWGFASVIIGETLVGSKQVGLLIAGAVMGSIFFRLLVAIALRCGLNPNDLKLITAAFVLVALVLPDMIAFLKKKAETQ